MPSQRHSTRVGDDVLLDAAHKCVLLVGFRRTTLTDVARRAGVSRMTLYRRFPDVRSLVAALMTREFSGLLHQAAAEADGGVAPHRTGRDAPVPTSNRTPGNDGTAGGDRAPADDGTAGGDRARAANGAPADNGSPAEGRPTATADEARDIEH